MVWNGCVPKQISLYKNKLLYPEIIRGLEGNNLGVVPINPVLQM